LVNLPQISTSYPMPDNLTFSIIGNTPLHLAMDSAHAQAAVLLINAGADRGRVGFSEAI